MDSALVRPDGATGNGGPSGPRRRGERARTIPEQIADHVGIAVLNGEYRGGERIAEQEVANLYGVSRGPVREAIRALEKRGLVELFPRRGAYVVDITIDTIADVFNIRATLLGLAARSLAARSEAGHAIAELKAHTDGLLALAPAGDANPVSFALAVGRTGGVMYKACGNASLVRLLDQQNRGSLWGLIWRERPLDFLTPQRRAEAAGQWSSLAAAIAAGDASLAERRVRRALFDSRDHALRSLTALRGDPVDPNKLIRDPE